MLSRFTLAALLLAALSYASWAAGAGHDSNVFAVAVSPDSRIAATGGQNGIISLWSLPDLRPLRSWKAHTDGVTSLVFSADGHTLYSGSMDRTAQAWSVADGHGLASFGPHSDDVLFVALAPDGKRLAVASYDGNVVLWDVARHERLPAKLVGHTVDWRRDGRLISTASIDGTVRLYQPDGKLEASWKAHAGCPNVARFSPDGKRLLTCVDHLKVWSVASHKLLADVDPKIKLALSSAAWRPDGKSAVATTVVGPGLRFDAPDWASRPLLGKTEVQCAAYSPDGRFLVVGNLHGTVDVIDAVGGKLLATRPGQAKPGPLAPRK